MENEDHDKIFFVNFGAVLAVLGAIFVVCIVAARLLIPDTGPSPESLAALENRIKPAATVVTDPSMLVKVSEKAARQAYTGEEVLAKACNACHQTGVLNAPKSGDAAAWAARSKNAGGLDGLVASAIKGMGAMPPRGGLADLSDDEIRAAIELMLK